MGNEQAMMMARYEDDDDAALRRDLIRKMAEAVVLGKAQNLNYAMMSLDQLRRIRAMMDSSGASEVTVSDENVEYDEYGRIKSKNVKTITIKK